MYNATKKEVLKTMRHLDMTIPRTMPRLIATLRTTNEALVSNNVSNVHLWFTEEAVLKALDRAHGQVLTIGSGTEPYYYLERNYSDIQRMWEAA